jgi:hypothetical protein
MADFRTLAANLGTAQGALDAASRIAALAEGLTDMRYGAEQTDELWAIYTGLQHLNSVLCGLRKGVKRRIAELERELAQG